MSTTIASVMELFGNDNAPETFKLVVVTEVAVRLVTEVVETKVIVPVTICMSGVPVTEVGPP